MFKLQFSSTRKHMQGEFKVVFLGNKDAPISPSALVKLPQLVQESLSFPSLI